MENLLSQLGFHKNEITIYLALFEFGKVRAGKLIDHTELHRNLVYTALDALVERELVTKTMVSGVAEFSVNDPDSLVRELDEKKRLAEELVLELRKKQNIEVREVAVTEGIDGIMRACSRLLDIDEGETGYVLGGSSFSRQPKLAAYWDKFHKERIKKNQKFKILYDKSVSQQVLDARNDTIDCEAKYMPGAFDMPMWLYLSDDYCSICVANDEPIIVNLRSKEITDAFKQYFEYLWSQKVTTETGYESMYRNWDAMLDELEPGEEFYVLGAKSGASNDEVNTYLEKFHLRRIQKGVKVNMIASQDSYEHIKDRFVRTGDKDGDLSKLKLFPSEVVQPFQINLFRGKTYLFVFSEEPAVVKFDSAEVYFGFKSYFDTLWNQNVSSVTGYETVEGEFDAMLDELEPGDEYLVLGANSGNENLQLESYFESFHTRRVQKGVGVRMIASKNAYEQLNKRFARAGDPEGKISGLKPFPSNVEQPFQINLYNNKANLYVFSDPPT